jgi:hypothetical protein
MNITWVTGFYEADGCLTYGQGRPRIFIVQAHRGILEEIQQFVKLGHVYPRRTAHGWPKKNGKQGKSKRQWVLALAQADTAAFLRRILPHLQLSWRRRDALRALRLVVKKGL